LCVGLLVASAGCGGGGESAIEGIVTLDGKPLDKATVTFAPVEGGRPISGMTESDGTFKIVDKMPDGRGPRRSSRVPTR
jgi:hypothetical protein